MNTITALNQQFAENSIQFVQSPEGLPLVVMQHTQGTATVSLYAGQVLSYCPADRADMKMQPIFWMSSAAQFALGHAIRGGIPLCWPWFGPHNDEEKPKHGFARTEMWQVVRTTVQADALELVLTLPCTPDLAALWGEFSVYLTIRVGASLSVALKTSNLSDQTLPLSDALHSYFYVGDVEQVWVTGLEETDYLSKPENYARYHQTGAVILRNEMDHHHVNTAQTCVIHDPVLQRELVIEKKGSLSTIVWNPGAEKAERMTDMGKGEWRSMLCIETANTADDIVVMPPQSVHITQTIIHVRRLS